MQSLILFAKRIPLRSIHLNLILAQLDLNIHHFVKTEKGAGRLLPTNAIAQQVPTLRTYRES